MSLRHITLDMLMPDCGKPLATREAMNAGYVTAIAALAGAALGGLTSFASSWTTLHAQMKAQRLASSRLSRQELYKQFIDEASRTYVDALMHDGGVDPLLDFSDVCRQELETDLLA